jgi:hypothetical protein
MLLFSDGLQVQTGCDPSKLVTHIVRGHNAILRMGGRLVELSRRSNQHGAMDHLKYFLNRPKFKNKNPCLVLMGSGSSSGSLEEIEGAILLYEYQIAGVGCRIFVADYHGGDRTVIAPFASRAWIASLGCATLLAKGALAVQLTYATDSSSPGELFDREVKGDSHWRRASSVRMMHGFVPLEETFDATLGSFGKHTRRNLRASRRHAEAALGYVFDANPDISKENFMELNHRSTHPIADDLAAWRYDAIRDLLSPGSLFLGIRGSNREWLSLIGGRRQENGTYVEWQMNRVDMADHSPGTLMRSHLLEHEVELGSRRLYLVGGTSHSMKHAFGVEHFVDLVAMRSALPGLLLRRLARPQMLENTFLLQTLANPKLEWERW